MNDCGPRLRATGGFLLEGPSPSPGLAGLVRAAGGTERVRRESESLGPRALYLHPSLPQAPNPPSGLGLCPQGQSLRESAHENLRENF